MGGSAARSAKTAIAETHLAEVDRIHATRAYAARRDREREQLAADVAAARKHSEEIGREVVALESPSVSAYPKGFHDWALERRDAWFAGFNVGWTDCCRRDQPGAAC